MRIEVVWTRYFARGEVVEQFLHTLRANGDLIRHREAVWWHVPPFLELFLSAALAFAENCLKLLI